MIRQKVGDSSEGVRPFGVFFKRFYNNARFGGVRFNISRFRIIHIAKGSAHQPLASTDFLADTTVNILNEVIAVILALSERHLQHEFPLRSWLKPKCRKTQRNDFGRVYCVNDAPAINTIASKTVRMPREDAYAVHRVNAGHYFVKKFTTGFATYVLKTKGQTFWPPEEVEKYGFQIIQFEPKDSPAQRPKVGVGVMILKDNKVLLGKRKGSHGEGEYAFPGGHLEYMESFADCARREVNEECGIEIDNIRFQYLANITKYTPKHYTHIGLVADWKSGEPKVLEPEKSESWDWYDMDNLPQPIFEMCKLAVECHKTGKNYLDVSDLK